MLRSCSSFGNVQTVQQHGGVALGRVAAFFADNAFEFAEPHAVFVGQLGLCVKHLAFLQRLPQRLVAHDHRVDHAESVERELILAQNAELLRPRDGALLRLHSPVRIFMKVDLPAPLGPVMA